MAKRKNRRFKKSHNSKRYGVTRRTRLTLSRPSLPRRKTLFGSPYKKRRLSKENFAKHKYTNKNKQNKINYKKVGAGNSQLDDRPFSYRNEILTNQKLIRRYEVCRRRKIRKEIIHALNKSGKGKGNKPPKWKPSSYLKC